MIYRITDTLATHYYELHRDTFPEQTACMLLFYAIIMMNTELHNVNVKTRRSADQLIADVRVLSFPPVQSCTLRSRSLSRLYSS